MSMVMKLRMSENQACQSQVHVTALRCLRVKPRKKRLNRRLRPVLWRGDWFSHITLSHDWETDGQHDTREWSSHSDPAHC
jgi:hypothetical protein